MLIKEVNAVNYFYKSGSIIDLVQGLKYISDFSACWK